MLLRCAAAPVVGDDDDDDGVAGPASHRTDSLTIGPPNGLQPA